MQTDPKASHRDASQGFTIVLLTIFSVMRTVQIWSRIPGTAGPWFFGPFLLAGIVLQAWYYQANVNRSLVFDFFPITSLIGMYSIWLAVHTVRHTYFTMRGQRFHSYEPGIGILVHFLPAWRSDTVGLVSDLITALTFSLIFRILGSPILSSWYLAMCVWILIAAAWFHARDGRNKQSRIDAQFEAQDFAQKPERNSQ